MGTSFEFASANATITALSATLVRVSAPPGVGIADVVFKIGGTENNRLVAAYAYLPNLDIDAVTPSSGTVEGGEQITITGAGLVGASVTFGGVAAEVVTQSDTELVVVAPARVAGTVDVVVTRDGLKDTLAGGYTYVDALEIWGFTPVRGSVAGDTFVALRGRGFEGELAVTLDGLAATQVRRIDRNNLTFRTPPHAEGEAVVALTAGGTTVDAPYTYVYYNPASRFGGASGGPVDGAVNVTVYSLGGGPLENAFVMLSTRADTPYQGFTDINGMITLSGPDVIGPQTTTATRAGYSTATIQTVDAENITLFLNLLDPHPIRAAERCPLGGHLWEHPSHRKAQRPAGRKHLRPCHRRHDHANPVWKQPFGWAQRHCARGGSLRNQHPHRGYGRRGVVRRVQRVDTSLHAETDGGEAVCVRQ
ncbi:MAG: IPT/TIG domain-containing protein [bacterium]